MTDTISRDEAIDRMKAELPCETYINNGVHNGVWLPTKFAHFDSGFSVFRKPPEPRRVAREWKNVQRIIYQTGQWSGRETDESIHVREVLPGDVTLDPMTEGQVFQLAKQCEVSTPVAERICRALGLIGEGS